MLRLLWPVEETAEAESVDPSGHRRLLAADSDDNDDGDKAAGVNAAASNKASSPGSGISGGGGGGGKLVRGGRDAVAVHLFSTPQLLSSSTPRLSTGVATGGPGNRRSLRSRVIAEVRTDAEPAAVDVSSGTGDSAPRTGNGGNSNGNNGEVGHGDGVVSAVRHPSVGSEASATPGAIAMGSSSLGYAALSGSSTTRPRSITAVTATPGGDADGGSKHEDVPSTALVVPTPPHGVGTGAQREPHGGAPQVLGMPTMPSWSVVGDGITSPVGTVVKPAGSSHGSVDDKAVVASGLDAHWP